MQLMCGKSKCADIDNKIDIIGFIVFTLVKYVLLI